MGFKIVESEDTPKEVSPLIATMPGSTWSRPPAIRGRLVGFYEIAYQIAAVCGFWINYGIAKTIPETSSVSWSAKGIRNRLVIGAFIMMWQNMSGINAINFYSPTLFAEIGIKDTALYTGIYGVLKALASLVFFAFLVDTWGRRPPLFFGGIASGLCLLYVAIYLKIGHPDTEAVVSASTAAGGKAATAGIMLFSIFYCMVSLVEDLKVLALLTFDVTGMEWTRLGQSSVATSPFLFFTRIFSRLSALRSIQPGFVDSAPWFIIARETPDMSATLGWGMFLLFSMFNFASVVFVYFFIPETKGRTLEDMDNLFGVHRPDEDGPKLEAPEMVEDTKQIAHPQEAEHKVDSEVSTLA
ncbi:hypothetical protein P7C70_g5766, partial [Phenoliferia sp. Uapishka_3]